MNKELEQAAKEWFAKVECTTPEEAFIGGANWQSEQDNWISCSERLPETDTTVLAITTYEKIVIGYFMLGDEWDLTGFDGAKQLDFITHWQPLPKKPF